MASAVIAATNTSSVLSASTTHVINLPSGITSGQLLVVKFMMNGSEARTWPSGWTQLAAQTVNATGAKICDIYYRIADGTEGSTITVTNATTNRQSWHESMRITGHGSSTTAPTSANAFGTVTANPDPPSRSVPSSQDWLFIACASQYTVAYSYTPPTGYTEQIDRSQAGLFSSSIAYKSVTAQSSAENPAVFTASSGTAAGWIANTIAVFPGTEGSGASTVTKTASLGALLQKKDILKTASLGALLQKQGIAVTASADGLVQKQGVLQTASLGALLLKSITVSAQLNALLQKTGIIKTSSLDAVLQKTRQITASIDAILQSLGTVTKTASLGALLQKQGIVKTAVIGALLQKNIQITSQINSLLQKQGIAKTASLGALLQKNVNINANLSALLQKQSVAKTALLDALC